MEIRKFTESDRLATIELWEACELTRSWNNPNKDIDRKLNFQSDLFFVGEVDSKLIASAMAGYDGHRGSVFYLAVHPNHQGQGLGRQLMNHLETALIKLGCPKLNIVIRSTNTSVLRFYNTLEYTSDDVVSLGKRLIVDK